MHIGLIGGIGPAATAFYYRKLVSRCGLGNQKLELTITHADISSVIKNIVANDANKQAEAFVHSVRRLEAAGADVIGVASIAAHFCIEELKRRSPLPVVDAITEVRLEIERRELKRVGILGTKGAMESRVFDSFSTEEAVLPQGPDLERVHDAYIAMANTGVATDEQRDRLFSIGEDLFRNRGAESIILAGTDLFLAFEGHDCGFPTVDCALLHVEALYHASLDGSTSVLKVDSPKL